MTKKIGRKRQRRRRSRTRGLSPSEKQVIVDWVWESLPNPYQPLRRCLHLAMLTERLATKIHPHRRFLFQAGTAFWLSEAAPAGPEEQGVQFGSEWSVDRLKARGDEWRLPPMLEMHCWVVDVTDPNRVQVIDLSTRHIAEQASQFGHTWSVEPLPDFIWSPREGLPYGTQYVADPDATQYARAHCGILRIELGEVG